MDSSDASLSVDKPEGLLQCRRGGNDECPLRDLALPETDEQELLGLERGAALLALGILWAGPRPPRSRGGTAPPDAAAYFAAAAVVSG